MSSVVAIGETHELEGFSLVGVNVRAAATPEAAVAAYRRSLELNPGNAAGHHLLGSVLFKLGRLEEAIVEYRAALKHEPDLLRARVNLVSALRRQGHVAEAVEQAETLLEAMPEDVGLRTAHHGYALAVGEILNRVVAGEVAGCHDQIS